MRLAEWFFYNVTDLALHLELNAIRSSLPEFDGPVMLCVQLMFTRN
jgi:hypothetical protein